MKRCERKLLSSEKSCSLKIHNFLLADFGKKASIHLQLIETTKKPFVILEPVEKPQVFKCRKS